MIKTIGIIYFSTTGMTKLFVDKVSNIIHNKGYQAKEINITSHKSREKKISFDEFDVVIFGFPIYGRQAPKPAREWLKTIKVEKKRCAMFFTYGGVMRGDIHNSTKKLLEESGFEVIASAEFLAKHTFSIAKGWELLENYPRIEDFDVAKEYTIKLLDKFNEEKIEPITFKLAEDNLAKPKPLKKDDSREQLTIEKPSRKDQDCSMCRDCEELCSTGAFNADTGEADKDKCIWCMHCIAICPDEVIEINDLTEYFKFFKERLALTDELLNSRKSQYFI